MLRKILDEGLQPDVHVVFANTGKERNETLDFVRDCAEHWGVRIVWLEHRRESMDTEPVTVEVDYETASRDGFPFTQLVQIRGFLPNPTSRFCTQELKIRTMKRWMMAQGHDHWTNVIGLRADEPHRVARMRAGESKERWDNAMPLYEAGVTERDVLGYWRTSPFDLRLRTWEGNCDECFLKSTAKRMRIMRDRPELTQWWIDREKEAEATATRPEAARFRNDTPSYEAMLRAAHQPTLFALTDLDSTSLDDLGDCVCHD